MYVLAHIGKVPVEEWVPFVAPLLALYLYGRRRDRARRRALGGLPDVREGVRRDLAEIVLERWRERGHERLGAEPLALLYPPGPEGLSAGELAERTGLERGAVERQLTRLERLGYLELDEHDDFDGPCVSLTVEGHDVVEQTEAALLDAAGGRAQARADVSA